MRATYTSEAILGNRSRVLVLRVLRGVGVPLNASQVATRTGLTHPAASTALRQLAAMGMVNSSPAGRATVHWLARENLYVQEVIEPIFAAEEHIPEMLVDDLRDTFEEFTLSVVIFGSYARGNQEAESDVDVILVVSSHDEETALQSMLDEYSAEFRRRFGASLSPLVYLMGEAAHLRTTAPELWQSILGEGLTVAGVCPADWGDE